MRKSIDERSKQLFESGATGEDLRAGLEALDTELLEWAAPTYPDEDDIPPQEARDLARRFRALRDEHRGELVAPRSLVTGEPGRVAAALIAEGDVRMQDLEGRDLRAAQHELAEALVDLQSFRPDDEAALILAGPTDPEAAGAIEALRTARAAMITWIRDDPSVRGALNAMGPQQLAIGDARKALDAVNGYREKQAFGFLAIFGGGALVVIVILVVIAFVAIRVLS